MIRPFLMTIFHLQVRQSARFATVANYLQNYIPARKIPGIWQGRILQRCGSLRPSMRRRVVQTPPTVSRPDDCLSDMFSRVLWIKLFKGGLGDS